MKYYLKIWICLCLVWLQLCNICAAGDGKSRVSIGGQGLYGLMLENNPYFYSRGFGIYDISAGFQTRAGDGCRYAESYNFPITGAGISVVSLGSIPMKENSSLKNLYAVYNSFQRILVRGKHFSSGYIFNLGIAYNPNRYDPAGNPGNTMLSSAIMAYFGAGFFASLHIGDHTELGLNLMYRHYSNGRLALPNAGIDYLGAGVAVKYKFYAESGGDYAKTRTRPEFEKGMVYHIAIGGGVHACHAEFKAYNKIIEDPALKQTRFRRHPKFSLCLDAMYRYSLKFATGLSLDLYYSSNMKDLEKCDRILYGDEAVENCPGYAPVSIGIAAVQEIYWRNVAGYIAVGAYPYRKKGIAGYQGWHYEKAGMRYYFPCLGDTFAGIAIKAHNFKAEYFELSVGVRLKGHSKKDRQAHSQDALTES